MDVNNVPQDNISTYGKAKKAIYAKGENGKLQTTCSTGWNVEETVTTQALQDMNEHMQKAFEEVKSGKKSPLYYYMYKKRMDLLLLSQVTGFFKWRIKRDFDPKVFAKMKTSRLLEYCDVFGIELDDIKRLPIERV